MDYIFITLLGTLIGSFLNVCIYRIPEGKSIVFPPSRCGNCNQRLKHRDLIPVISFIIAKGKCRYCSIELSKQYPIIEAITGVLFLVAFIVFGMSMQFVLYSIILSLLLVIVVIDYKSMIIPDGLVLSIASVGILWQLIETQSKISFTQAIVGGAVGFGVFAIIAILSNGAMGGGDVKLMGALGLLVGTPKILAIANISFILGALIGLLLIATKIKTRKDYIPFGPFIALSAMLVIFFDISINDIYYWISSILTL